MKSIKIGTRKSPLALWQAREVARHLQNRNFKTDITPILSKGDKQLNQPLYQMGITGVFTRDLDTALLNKEIDIAVHSLKDVPTLLPEGLELVAFLKRDYHQDVLVRSQKAKSKRLEELTLATSSLRRRAFWLEQFPDTSFVDIRGNVQTRLDKIESGLADATLFSKAGLARLELKVEFEELPFMLSAPSQGVVVVTARTEDLEIKEILQGINDRDTQICVEIERAFLQTLEGGCTAPIGAYAEIIEEDVRFQGRICTLDGRNCIGLEEILSKESPREQGIKMAQTFLNSGAKEIMEEVKPRLGGTL
ncbi:hydroxymethylbilane synthase [Chryseobacterium sp. A301]